MMSDGTYICKCDDGLFRYRRVIDGGLYSGPLTPVGSNPLTLIGFIEGLLEVRRDLVIDHNLNDITHTFTDPNLYAAPGWVSGESS